MGKKCLKIVLGLTFGLLMSTSAQAQSADDVLRYSQQYPTYDAVSIVMPGVSDATGFGVFQENPAAMALFGKSFVSLGLSNRYVNEDGTYRGNTTGFDDNQANVGNAGFVYNIPTTQGRLTIGAGYSQSHDFNRAVAGSARNDVSTITDFYADLPVDDELGTAAFNAFAIEDVTNDNDEVTDTRSIFRFPVGSAYPGINQDFELTERGTLGEFSAFIATEFQKNLIIGASIGVISGTYENRLDFLESDDSGDYDGDFIITDEGDTDIDRILSEDFIDATFAGFSARLGLLYKASQNFNIGASYQFKNTLHVDEDYGTYITTTLDNGLLFEGDFIEEGLKYKITRPSRLNLGFTAKDLSGLTISASAERVAYSEGRIEFESNQERATENDINTTVQSNFEDVYNLRFGLEYAVTERITPRIGYGYYPDPLGDFEEKELNSDRQFYSAGFSILASENTKFNLGVQLSRWDDDRILYETPDVDEVVNEEINRLSVMAGLTFNF